MAYSISISSVEQLKDIISEADENKAFLPHRYEPDFKVLEFLGEFDGAPGFYIFGMNDDSKNIIGFIAVLPAKNREVLYIGPMYIRSGHQGKGLGRLQLEQLLAWAKKNRYRKAHTKTWGGNLRSRRIFEELGFKVFEELPDQRVNGDSSIKYELEIQNLL